MFSLTIYGGLAFTLVTLVLYTLAHQLDAAISRHELIREARLQQVAYLRSVAERRRGANADYDEPAGSAGSIGPDDGFDVDIVDDEPAPLRRAA